MMQDFANRSITKLTFPPLASRGGLSNNADISRTEKIEFDETLIQCGISSENGVNSIKIVPTGSAGFVMANGLMLGFHEEWSTVADISRLRRYVFGRGFAGCLYTVLDTGNGQFRCVHTSRQGGKDADKTVEQLKSYVMRNRFRVVHQVPTAGFIGAENGCVQVWIATRVDYTINPKPAVQTARLQVSSIGNIVHTDVFSNH